jgi:hypothetical protein
MPETDPNSPHDIPINPCAPGVSVLITIVRCKDNQPIILFTISTRNLGTISTPNNGTNRTMVCLVQGDTFRVSANGFKFKDVIVTRDNIRDRFLEVCLDEDAPPEQPKGKWPYCFILTLLGVNTTEKISKYADTLRLLRDILLGTPNGNLVVKYYYNEEVQKELTSLLSSQGKIIEIFQILVEATPFIFGFVKHRPIELLGKCNCEELIPLDSKLAEKIDVLLQSLLKEAKNDTVIKAIKFALELLKQSIGKYPGQILSLLGPVDSRGIDKK